ncbi:MAG: cell division protein FtsZ [Parcubacteria group bacterium Licking1014_17]|nr:MAG: cell division protein FtsZ [Parcubacteria group bacterium Licking1014_17]
MPQVKPQFEAFARIKVVGIGGGGNKAIQRMMVHKIHGVEFVAVNLDAQDLNIANAPTKILIGKNLTRGLGAGMNPELGRQAAQESIDEIGDVLKGSDMVFITAGLGGGTGTGAAPIIAEVARDVGALTVGVVTKPFSFEGVARARIADEGWVLLRDKVDALITISNDRLLSIIDRKTPLLEAFQKVDDVLRQGVQGISDLITIPGIINVDFADVKTIMANSGSALMGIGFASGEDRAIEAAKAAISSPLLDISIDGARGVLFNVSGGADLAMSEINEAARVITSNIDSEAKVIFGAVQDDTLNKGEIKVTVIAAGFNSLEAKAHKTHLTEVLFGGMLPVNGKRIGEIDERQPMMQKKVKEKTVEGEVVDTSVDEGEFDIPAFIRRKIK